MKYKKPPENQEVEALQYKGQNARALMEWAGSKVDINSQLHIVRVKADGGVMYGTIGDYIIKDADGSLELCRPALFSKLYIAVV